MKFISCAVALASGILSFSSAVEAKSDPLVLWTITNAPGRRLNEHIEFKNRRLATVGEKFFFEFHSTKVDGLEDKVAIAFDMPENGQIVRKECLVKTGNPLVPEKLADQFPDLLHFRGICPNGEELTMLIDTTKVDGMSASFVTMNSKYKYIDNAADGTNEYVVYDHKDALEQGVRPEIDEDVVVETEAEQFQYVAKEVIAERQNRVSTSAYKFKLACIAHRTYSQFHGNTLQSVMAALITLWTRVNGVYAHEFGVFFEFVENQQNAICLNGVTDSACTALSNSGSILSQSASFLTGKGIAYSSYDVGHSVTTGSGGVASYPSLCTAANKARGTTGLPQPINDAFAIDYVAHEMGHQFFGPHSFMDCAGSSDGNFMLVGACEPGSASSIMGYAGICGAKNIQTFSDPYFTNLNQQQMYDYVRSVQNDATCGKAFPLNNLLPTITTPASCSVPVGNNFQLKGISTTDPAAVSSFSWDRSDTAFESFTSTTLGRFRSWKPTPARTRFFPNLHFLNFPTTQQVERLPTVARSMKFRFTERRLYDTGVVAPEFDLGVMGDFVYADTTVNYVSMTPLTLVAPARNSVIKSGESFTFQWTPGGTASLSSTVDLFIAENTLQTTTAFDYEIHNKEFNWIKIGSAALTAGSATFVVPTLSNTGNVAGNVMIKASSLTGAQSDLCFFFDLSTGLTVERPAAGTTSSPTVQTTPAPVSSTTSLPTPAPTPAPVQPVTASPTPAPVQPVTASPTPAPVQPVTASPTKFPVVAPTTGSTIPIASPTPAPVASPSSGPVATLPVEPGFFSDIPVTFVALMVGMVAVVVILAGVLAFCIVSTRKTVKKQSSLEESEEEVKRVSVAVAGAKPKADKYLSNAVSTKNNMFSDV